jgi:hypothetical protein
VQRLLLSESGQFRFRCVLFDTKTGTVSGRFCPSPPSEPWTTFLLGRRRHESNPRPPITKYIVYTCVLMILLYWPAAAVVRSGFAGPLVGMAIALSGQRYFPPGCGLRRDGKDWGLTSSLGGVSFRPDICEGRWCPEQMFRRPSGMQQSSPAGSIITGEKRANSGDAKASVV